VAQRRSDEKIIESRKDPGSFPGSFKKNICCLRISVIKNSDVDILEKNHFAKTCFKCKCQKINLKDVPPAE
jgi:hypothetical protein